MYILSKWKDKSKSLQDSTHSPGDKGTREEAGRVLSTSSQTNKVCKDPGMAGDLWEKIKHVLQKAGKAGRYWKPP